MALAPESSRGVGLLAVQDFILGTGGAPWFSASLLGLLWLDERVAFLHLWGEDWVLTAVQTTDPYWSPGGRTLDGVPTGHCIVLLGAFDTHGADDNTPWSGSKDRMMFTDQTLSDRH